MAYSIYQGLAEVFTCTMHASIVRSKANSEDDGRVEQSEVEFILEECPSGLRNRF